MRSAIAAIATALVLCVAGSALASASIYRGSARHDAQMPVKLTLSGQKVTFDYSHVLTGCSDGSEVRQGGAVHTTDLNQLGKFKDTFEEGEATSEGGEATSLVRGKVEGRKATGIVSFDLVYPGGECHSEKVEWKARRK